MRGRRGRRKHGDGSRGPARDRAASVRPAAARRLAARPHPVELTPPGAAARTVRLPPLAGPSCAAAVAATGTNMKPPLRLLLPLLLAPSLAAQDGRSQFG